jgi:hypothetical protein
LKKGEKRKLWTFRTRACHQEKSAVAAVPMNPVFLLAFSTKKQCRSGEISASRHDKIILSTRMYAIEVKSEKFCLLRFFNNKREQHTHH